MIDRIEFAHLPNQGVAITFHYDSECMDTFSIFERSHVNEIMELIATQPEPEFLLIAIRDLGRLSLH